MRSVLIMDSPAAACRLLISVWPDPVQCRVRRAGPPAAWNAADFDPHVAAAIEHMSLLNIRLYLPDDILVKIDRAAMAVGLKTRVALLDHRIVEFTLGKSGWLCGRLRDWAEALLAQARLVRKSVFAMIPVRQAWQADLSGAQDLSDRLSAALMWQACPEQQARSD